MLLYRLTKMMEEHSRLKHNIQQTDGDLLELMQMKEQMEEQLFGPYVEDAADWAVEATY